MTTRAFALAMSLEIMPSKLATSTILVEALKNSSLSLFSKGPFWMRSWRSLRKGPSLRNIMFKSLCRI